MPAPPSKPAMTCAQGGTRLRHLNQKVEEQAALLALNAAQHHMDVVEAQIQMVPTTQLMSNCRQQLAQLADA